MKLFKTLLISFITLLFLNHTSFAENIGYIQMDKILLTYKDAINFQKDLDEKRKSYEEALEKHQEKIKKAEEKNKSEKHIQDLVKKMEKELLPQQEQIIQFDAQAKQRLLTEIKSATSVVAKDYNIDVVVDHQVIIVGGFDLTDFVIDKLNR